MSGQKSSGYHTQLPNLMMDFIIPQLSEGESKCLLYIIRRTKGFASTDGGRKEWDQISLSQFEKGIVSGRYTIDVGTGMTRPSITKALDGLQEKGLVKSSWECAHCFWQGDSKKCPQCRRQCDRSFSLVPLSSKMMLQFLNQFDRDKRQWSFDAEVMRFIAQDRKSQGRDEELQASEEEFINELWYPEIVEKIMEQMNKSFDNKRTLTSEQKINHFYKPVLELQKLAHSHPQGLKHALEACVEKNIAGQREKVTRDGGKVSYLANYKWHRYAASIIRRQLGRPGFATHKNQPNPQLEDWANDLLKRARDLNRKDETDAARALLSELLGKTEPLALLLKTTPEDSDCTIRWAYKIGEADLLAAKDTRHPVYDFYPEWNPPSTWRN